MNSRVDSDFCAKSFESKKGFAFGVFSVGCSCPANITYGWEVMLSRESAHNLFRLLMCRNLDMQTLEGVIFDFACGLDPYLLNRRDSTESRGSSNSLELLLMGQTGRDRRNCAALTGLELEVIWAVQKYITSIYTRNIFHLVPTARAESSCTALWTEWLKVYYRWNIQHL